MKIKNLKENRGVSGVDIAIAVVIITIFVSIIGTAYYNAYNTSVGIRVDSKATEYLVKILEYTDEMQYENVTVSNLEKLKTEFNIPKGYDFSFEVKNYNENDNSKLDIIKTVKVNLSYKFGQKTEKISIEKLKVRE